MKFGIHIGHMGGPLGEMRKLWKFADAKGFDWFSVSDHFQESPPRGGEMDCYEAISTLTAAAMDTQRIRLGSGVYCVAYRNPGLLAKSLTTIDHLSNGRVDCGLGAGWHDVEAKAYGYAFPSIGPREDMLEEYAQIMRLILDRERRRANFEGTHFRVSDAPNNPKPLQPRIPIWIGGRGDKRTPAENKKFAEKYHFNFPLICDTDRTIGTAYGANADPQKGAQRVGVVIDREGRIKEWHARVDARAWPAEVVKTL